MVSQGAVVTSQRDAWAYDLRIGTDDARFALAGLVHPRPGLNYLAYRNGVFAAGDTGGVGGSSHMGMRVRPKTGMQVTVEPGNCLIDTSNQGPYLCALDPQATITLAASSSTLNRYSLIVARVYDDQNSAIGSPANTRNFGVEEWIGDGVTGTASIPDLTGVISAGYHPLAAVRVNKNANTIATGDIIDLRGPALPRGGGARALFGDDAKTTSAAFLENGSAPGERRWVHTNGFQDQVWYGSQDGWRGVHNCLVYSANPAPGATFWTRGVNSTTEMCRVSIPYPGTPYMIEPTARAFLYYSYNTSVDVRINIGNVGGNAVNWVREDTFGTNEDHTKVVGVPPLKYGPFTTGTDVVLSGAVRECPTSAHGFGFRGDDVGQTLLQVSVLPSTVQPPAV